MSAWWDSHGHGTGVAFRRRIGRQHAPADADEGFHPTVA